jgi:quercetin dioxygenase-like cupin family protein
MVRRPVQSWRLVHPLRRRGLALVLCFGPAAAGPLGAQHAEPHAGPAPQVVLPDAGQRVVFRDGRVARFKVGPAGTGASYFFLLSEDMPPGTAVPRHRHEVDEELLIVTRGRVTVALNDSVHQAPAGSVIYLPPRAWVAVRNAGPDTATVMAVFPRGAIERCFQFAARALGQSAPLPPEAERLDPLRACHMTFRER